MPIIIKSLILKTERYNAVIKPVKTDIGAWIETSTKIKLKSRDKENGNFVKISLSHLEKLHFKLIYNLCYIDHYFPDKISQYNFSEDLAELYGSEEKVINLYKEIKKIALN